MNVLLLILSRIAPIFVIMAIGYLAFSLKWVDMVFTRVANNLVYRVALPALIFLSVAGANFSGGLPLRQLIAFIAGLVASLLISFLVSRIARHSPERRAAFVQGSIRGNFAILGFAVIEQVLGTDALREAALYFAFFMPVHNLVGIAVLSAPKNAAARAEGSTDEKDAANPAGDGAAGTRPPGKLRQMGTTLLTAITNPLMIAVYLGVVVSLLSVKLPTVITDSLGYLRQLALPLALIGIGGSLATYYSGRHFPTAMLSTILKLVVMPLVAVIVGMILGLGQQSLIMLAVFAGSPAAVASYALADAMGADRDTAGSIIVVTHAACLVTMAVAITAIQVIVPAA